MKEETKKKKWNKLINKLEKAHIVWLEKLAKITISEELDSKEIRANISLFKQEKDNHNISNQDDDFSFLQDRLEEISK